MEGTEAAPKVGLLVTCLVNTFCPSVAFSSIQLLEQAGCQVEVPMQQVCCGQVGYNNGEHQLAVDTAKRMIQLYEPYDYIVAPSGSCAAMMSVHYPKLLRDHADWYQRAVALKSKVYELTTFLVQMQSLPSTPSPAPAADTKALVYHDGCSGWRELGIRTQPRQLLAQQGLEVKELADPEACCGFGGTFCAKYPDIASHISDKKIQHILDSQCQTVVGGDLGCLLAIKGRLKRRDSDCDLKVQHVADVLAGAQTFVDQEPSD